MRKVCIFTGTRAEYGLLRWVMQGIQDAPDLTLQILATGMHLSPEFGMTIEEIRSDGFEADETVEILLSGDTPTAVCKSMGLGLIGYGEAIQRLSPDIVVVLGDRFETFCMAAAAQVCRVPLAHIHGGESTVGAVDEALRHSITKMSHLHFASCEAYRQRIIQLGEAPDRVFNVGALGVENIRRAVLMERSELAESIGFNLDKPYFLVTFHPVTLEQSTAKSQFEGLLEALDAFPEFNVILTKANADTDGRVINSLVDDYAGRQPERCMAVASLGTGRYLSAMKHSSAVIGNSSSGIIEAPALAVPSINIGDRQKGRLQANSTLNCFPDTKSIAGALRRALSPSFQEALANISIPFEQFHTSLRIIEALATFDIKSILNKTFYDLNLH